MESEKAEVKNIFDELPYSKILLDSFSYSPESILDMGCGNGLLDVLLKIKFPQCQITGCDIALESLTVAIQTAKLNKCDINFDYCDVSGAMPYPDKSFEIVMSSAMAMMIPEREALNMVNNMKRLAKKKIVMVELHMPQWGEREMNFNGVFGRYGRDYSKFFWKSNRPKITPIPNWPGETYKTNGSLIEINL